MKSGITALLVICGITVAASRCAFAFTDAELIAAGDGFDSRRDTMLASQVARPYPPGKPDSPNVWGLQDYALAALYLNKELPKANKAVIEAVDLMLGDATQMNSSGHWKGNLFFRIYRFFAHDSKYFPGRLTPAAEAKICDFFWEWARSRSKISHADINTYQTWSYWGSENHDGQRNTTAWSAASILKDVAPYNTYTYDDGSTAQQQYDALTAYAKEYLRQRAKKGLCIEIGTPTYTKYTLQGWYNYYDFAEDQQLKKIAGMTLDLWWADWAESQINSVWGGGKSRVYAKDSTNGADGTAAMSWYYLNIGSPKSKHPGIMCMATTTHRLPLVVMDIALDISGRGVYEKRSRRPGLKKLPVPANTPAETTVCDPDFGGNARYTYVRPEFILGTCMVQKRSDKDWTGISMQNRWHGAIFANHRDSRVFPAVEGVPVSYGKTYNAHWSVQNKGTLITQKIAQKHNGDMRVYFSSKHLKISESHGCVFADTGDAYVAVRPAWGSYKWDDKNWIRFSDPFAPAIMEVAVAADYNKKLSNFIKAVLSKKPSVSKGILTYTGVGDSGTFTFDTKGSQTPTVNGTDVDYAPKYTFKSPFMNEDWASGVITIKKDGREKVLDFTNKQIVSGQAAFERADKAQYKTVFSDSCTGDWTKKWFLDGQVGTVTTGTDGMTLTAGPQFKNDSHHMVLWTKDSFKGDLKIEYEYTRLDSETRCVNILYIQATGSGEEPYAEDISKWNELRKVPSMKTYYNHMNTYHISYAAFPNVGDSRNSYIRARRYMPNRTGLKGTNLKPDYYPKGLFATGVPHKITVIKKDRDIFMRIENPEQVYYCRMTNTNLPIVTQGRIGLRHMFTRSARYKNFRISTSANQVNNERE